MPTPEGFQKLAVCAPTRVGADSNSKTTFARVCVPQPRDPIAQLGGLGDVAFFLARGTRLHQNL